MDFRQMVMGRGAKSTAIVSLQFWWRRPNIARRWIRVKLVTIFVLCPQRRLFPGGGRNKNLGKAWRNRIWIEAGRRKMMSWSGVKGTGKENNPSSRKPRKKREARSPFGVHNNNSLLQCICCPCPRPDKRKDLNFLASFLLSEATAAAAAI